MIRNRRMWLLLAVVAGAGAFIAGAQESGGYPHQEILLDPPPGEWLNYGRDQDGTHHSPLDQVDADNVDRLGPGLELRHRFVPGPTGGDADRRGRDHVRHAHLERGVRRSTRARAKRSGAGTRGSRRPSMLPTGAESGTGAGPSLCCGPVNRGVALYDGKVYVGLLNGSLAALDAGTGEEVWRVQVRSPLDDYSITGRPAHRRRHGDHGHQRRRVRRARLRVGL